MITTDNICSWVRKHSYQQTMRIIDSGEIIYFQREGFSSATPLFFAALHAAEIYVECKREDRRQETASALAIG